MVADAVVAVGFVAVVVGFAVVVVALPVVPVVGSTLVVITVAAVLTGPPTVVLVDEPVVTVCALVRVSRGTPVEDTDAPELVDAPVETVLDAGSGADLPTSSPSEQAANVNPVASARMRISTVNVGLRLPDVGNVDPAAVRVLW